MNYYLFALYKIIFIIIILHCIQTECPSCSSITCLSQITQSDCAQNYYLNPTAGPCGCCPACVTGRILGQSCSKTTASMKCVYGLDCSSDTITCVPDTSLCMHVNHLASNTLIKWLPTCDTQGNYKSIQCKGDRASGRCFCVDDSGDRLFGWDWWKDADDMTCACSRLRNQLELDNILTTLHCDSNGNFEELQCDNGICWCAEPKTGQIQSDTIAVPESMWTMLPCCKCSEYISISILNETLK